MTVVGGLAALLAVVFLWAGALNLTGPSFVRAEFDKWGYPAFMRIAVGLVEISAAAMLFWPHGQRSGAAIGGVVLVGVVVSLLRTREWLRLEYPAVLLVACVLLVAL